MFSSRSASYFSIMDAAFAGYRFAYLNRKYLAAIGIVPFIAEIASAFLIDIAATPDNSMLTNLLLGLPSVSMAGWFMFLATRLAVFGERADALPADRPFLAERGRLMWASIFIWMLFNMGVMLAATLLLSSVRILQSGGPNPALSMVNVAAIGVCFWGARYGVVHFLAAVDYPIRVYIKKVNGIGISLRLLGLGFLCAIPCGAIQQILMMPFLSDATPTGLGQLSDGVKIILVILGAVFSVIMTAIMSGACTDALKQILGARSRR